MSSNPTSYVFGGAPYEGAPFDPNAVRPEPMSIGTALRTQADADREAELVKALEPFAVLASFTKERQSDSRPIVYGIDHVVLKQLTIGDLRKARDALASYRRRT